MDRLRTLSLGLMVSAVLIPGLSHAQSAGPGDIVSRGGFQPPFQRQAKLPSKHDPAPPGIPGAVPQTDAAAPTDKSATDVPPTEALFDAINRGDLAAAKDALNRGADLDGRNVLGMTPIDLAVDLSRNDITFLLLSMRGSSGAQTANATSVLGKPDSSAAPPSKHLASAKSARSRHAAPLVTASSQVTVPATRYAANNPGRPVPQAGFLGFGGGESP